VSGESENTIEDKFVNGLGARYPLAKIKATAKTAYGIRAYPSYRLIAPDGTVHSHGKPDHATIERLLEDVTLAPKMPDEPRYAPVRQMWEKKQHKKLRDFLSKMVQQPKLDEQMREVYQQQLDELESRATRAAARVGKLADGPDYLRAKTTLETLQKDWRGFDVEKAAAAELKRFSKDATIKKEIAASKSLAKLRKKYPATTISKVKKLREALRKFADKHEGTYAGEQARKQLGR